MSFAYLPEHADNVLFALELAVREAAHLAYTHSTLFAQQIDLEWVKALCSKSWFKLKLRRMAKLTTKAVSTPLALTQSIFLQMPIR